MSKIRRDAVSGSWIIRGKEKKTDPLLSWLSIREAQRGVADEQIQGGRARGACWICCVGVLCLLCERVPVVFDVRAPCPSRFALPQGSRSPVR